MDSVGDMNGFRFFHKTIFKFFARISVIYLQWKLTIEVQAYLIKLFPIFIKRLISLSDIAFILDAPIFSMENNERPK